ncbi:hypothetical protein IWZ03DRAFT_371276 [Phyllosticta citriasiana]|uniref:Uncharacterized protein n=1 Tax=Phyllosticta citriasiana TaxID=595635 RepID=A0ABR1KYW9_9PEZI
MRSRVQRCPQLTRRCLRNTASRSLARSLAGCLSLSGRPIALPPPPHHHPPRPPLGPPSPISAAALRILIDLNWGLAAVDRIIHTSLHSPIVFLFALVIALAHPFPLLPLHVSTSIFCDDSMRYVGSRYCQGANVSRRWPLNASRTNGRASSDPFSPTSYT